MAPGCQILEGNPTCGAVDELLLAMSGHCIFRRSYLSCDYGLSRQTGVLTDSPGCGIGGSAGASGRASVSLEPGDQPRRTYADRSQPEHFGQPVPAGVLQGAD